MDSRWLKYETDTSQHEDLKKRIASCNDVLGILAKLVQEKLDANQIVRLPDYNDSAWACKQADLNGYIRALEEIQKLLDIENK